MFDNVLNTLLETVGHRLNFVQVEETFIAQLTHISRKLSYHRNFSKMFIFPVSEVFSGMNSPFEDIFDHEPY